MVDEPLLAFFDSSTLKLLDGRIPLSLLLVFRRLLHAFTKLHGCHANFSKIPGVHYLEW
jgi:hypothetical protein